MEPVGRRSDGLVPFESQIIPGPRAHLIALEGYDHIMPIGQRMPGSENPPRSAEALTRGLVAFAQGLLA